MNHWKNILLAVLALGWASTAALLVLPKSAPNTADTPADSHPPATNPEETVPLKPKLEPEPEPVVPPELPPSAPEPTPTTETASLPPPEPEPPLPPLEPADAPTVAAALAETMAAMRASPGFPGVAIGLSVLDGEGKSVFSDGGETAMIPASTLKTVTAATALEQLGTDFTFETQVRAASKPDAEGKLAGDLVLRGGGDPTLGTGDLQALARMVRATGVTTVEGRILADARFFPEQIASDFWNWGDVGNGYGSSAAGLNLDHNRFVAIFAPGATFGAPARFLGAGVELQGVEWINRVTTGAPGSGDGVMLYGGPQSASIYCFGTIPKDEERFGVVGAVPDPPRSAAHAFLKALRAQGITVAGTAEVMAADDRSIPPAELLASHASAPLPVIVRHLLKVSDNHEAECLFRLLARRNGKTGEQVVRDHWAARGLTFKGLRMVDGSGLARADFIRPQDMAQLLFLARRGDQGDVFLQSLNSHFKDRVHWKGGAMSSIRSWTGYVQREPDPPGNEWSFALIVNHFGPSADAAPWRDRIVRTLLTP